MNPEIKVLILTALSIGLVHTLIGPDHYIPFIALSRARQWSYPRTLIVTLICGLGHVLSSVVIGIIGIATGIAISRIKGLESLRGDIAAYLLLGFGLAYMSWGIRQAIRGKAHIHSHTHTDGTIHEHRHDHTLNHSHLHSGRRTAFWWLFIIFVLGPCEPLIPLLMVPAATVNPGGVALVTLAFGLSTIATMAVVVSLAYLGLKQVRFGFLERYAHALGGLLITLSGAGIIFLGL